MDEEIITPDTRELIMNKMDSEGRTLQWLAGTTKINYNTLHSCIKRKLFSLNQENLDKINEALETDFTLPENGTAKA
jgi:hypothetical protein